MNNLPKIVATFVIMAFLSLFLIRCDFSGLGLMTWVIFALAWLGIGYCVVLVVLFTVMPEKPEIQAVLDVQELYYWEFCYITLHGDRRTYVYHKGSYPSAELAYRRFLKDHDLDGLTDNEIEKYQITIANA